MLSFQVFGPRRSFADELAVQYTLPAAFVVILVKYLGTENSAVTWYQCPHV